MFSGMSYEGNQLHLTVTNRVYAAFKFISGAHVFNGMSTFVLKRRSDDKNDMERCQIGKRAQNLNYFVAFLFFSTFSLLWGFVSGLFTRRHL